MKVYNYIIELKKPDFFVVDMISRLMLILSIVMFGYTVYLIHSINWFTAMLLAFIAAMIAWAVHCYNQQRKGEIAYYRLGLLIATIGWGALTGPHWITILFFIAVISEKQVKFPREIAFDEEGVIINSFPKKQYSWNQVMNAMLKEGILTVDFKNNKLIQKQTESDTSAAEEQEFNEFCKTRLKA